MHRFMLRRLANEERIMFARVQQMQLLNDKFDFLGEGKVEVISFLVN